MKQSRWQRRAKKQQKARQGMRVDNRSILLLQEIINKKADKIRKDKEDVPEKA